MRQMSFSMTTEACYAKRKTVTRRLGWRNLGPGTLLQQIEKGQGLKKGEKVKKIHVVQVVSVRLEAAGTLERLPDAVAEVAREGLPHLTPAEFVERFCAANKCDRATIIQRIEFRYVAQPSSLNPQPSGE